MGPHNDHGTSWSPAVAEMGDRLATIDMGQKLGALPLIGGSWIPCNTVALAAVYLRTQVSS